jgi:hypothetical protein
MSSRWPRIVTACADCGVGTITAHEWYMVNDDVWEQAWRGRRKWWHAIEGQEVLCIGCLERRIGRTLVAGDFISDLAINDPNKRTMSARLRDRLNAVVSLPLKRKRGRPKGSKNKRSEIIFAHVKNTDEIGTT